MLLVYVDDIIVTEDNEEEESEISRGLMKEFEIKELERLKYFLGIEVAYSPRAFSYHIKVCDGFINGNREKRM